MLQCYFCVTLERWLAIWNSEALQFSRVGEQLRKVSALAVTNNLSPVLGTYNVERLCCGAPMCRSVFDDLSSPMSRVDT